MIKFECPSPDAAQGVWHFCVTMCTITGTVINTLSTSNLFSNGSHSRKKSEVGPGAGCPEVTNKGELHFSSANNRVKGERKHQAMMSSSIWSLTSAVGKQESWQVCLEGSVFAIASFFAKTRKDGISIAGENCSKGEREPLPESPFLWKITLYLALNCMYGVCGDVTLLSVTIKTGWT